MGVQCALYCHCDLYYVYLCLCLCVSSRGLNIAFCYADPLSCFVTNKICLNHIKPNSILTYFRIEYKDWKDRQLFHPTMPQ